MSVSQVAGQILSHYVLGEDAVSLEAGIKVVRVAPGALAGQNPIANRIRERTGCSIVAVERGDDVIVDFGAAFRFRKTDTVYICGTNDAIDDYYEVIADSRAPV
jgi:K+/H+ antiporter YhaU regulatory subunit KhtT